MALQVRGPILETAMSMGRPEQERDLAALRPAEDVRVLIVEDHKLFADALRWILERHGMDVVGVTTSGEEALEMARRDKPDLVLLDVTLAGMSGLSVGKKILQELPQTKVVAVTAVATPRTVKQAIGLGFHGYLTMDTPMRQFSASMQAVLAGQVVIPRRLAQATSGVLPPEEQAALALAEQLSQREKEILALLVEGLNNTEIARRLGIAQNTVRAHAQRVLTKLQVHSRLEAAAFAIRHGLAGPPDRGPYG